MKTRDGYILEIIAGRLLEFVESRNAEASLSGSSAAIKRAFVFNETCEEWNSPFRQANEHGEESFKRLNRFLPRHERAFNK